LTRHARRAALPPASYTRPEPVDASGLVVTVYGESGGIEAWFDFGVLPAPRELLIACAAGFARLAGPDCRWRAADTCETGFKAVREFLRHAATLPTPPQTAADITPALWAGWRLSRPNTVWGHTCSFKTRQWLPQVPGIPAETIAVAARRIPQRPPPSEAAYSRPEYERIKQTAARTFHTALVRIRANREHLRRWHAGEFQPGANDFMIGEALDSVLRTGNLPHTRTPHGDRSRPRRLVRALGGWSAEHTWTRLFLTMQEAYALAVLLVCEQGYNRAVLDEMTVPSTAPGAGEDDLDVYRVEIHKRRRPVRSRYTSNNLVDDGPGSAGRLMRQAIEATEPARVALGRRGEPTDRLLVARRGNQNSGPGMFHLGAPKQAAMRIWVAQTGLIGDNPDEPFWVNLRRLRRTVQVLVRKEPAHNSEQTHENVYVLPDPTTRREAEQVAAQGLTDAAEHARTIMRMRMLLAAGPDELTDYLDDPDTAQALIDGVLDTATGACLDFHDSPFTPPGQPCTASFLNCLACRNAVATRRHLPRLAYLHHALETLRGTVDAAVWNQDWRPHFLRLTVLLEENTTVAERAAAARGISDSDRDLIDRMLHGEYTA
jgi:hypothetical protein